MGEETKNGSDGVASAAGGIGGILIILFLLFIGFLNAPGMVLMGIIRDILSLHLDYGQMWTFSIIISLILYIVLRVSNKDGEEANGAYLLICGIIVAIFLIAKFGFKAAFPGRYIGFFIKI